MKMTTLIPLTLVCLTVLPTQAQQKKSGQSNSQVASLQRQVKTLREERDALKQQVEEFPLLLRQENAELYRQLDEANAQRERALDELDLAQATLKENQSGGEALLRELREARNDIRMGGDRIAALESEVASLQADLDEATNKVGALVHFGPDIIPAKCLNLRRMTPNVRRVSGVVVINCLIDEMGEPLEVRLIQGLPGNETEWVTKAHEASLEAAKRLAFEPATTTDGRPVKVWQGVAFYLN